MTKFLATTFSPTMVQHDRDFSAKEISLSEAQEALRGSCPVCGSPDRRDEGAGAARHCCAPFVPGFTSAVGHEVTARVLTALLGFHVPFNRANLSLDDGDTVICVIPSFRANEAREFSREEVEAAGFRCFEITVTEQ